MSVVMVSPEINMAKLHICPINSQHVIVQLRSAMFLNSPVSPNNLLTQIAQ
jgi:hypothetical protein